MNKFQKGWKECQPKKGLIGELKKTLESSPEDMLGSFDDYQAYQDSEIKSLKNK